MANKSSATETQGGTQDFTLTNKFTYGYRNREDITVLPPGVLVPGAQNVLTNTLQHIGIRKGYTLDGAANTDLAPIASSFDWSTSGGLERNMRSGFLTDAGNDGKLQFRYTHADNTIEWVDLMNDLTSVNFNYANFWDTSQLQNVIYFVNGTPNIYEWNGAATEMLSATNLAGQIDAIGKTPNFEGFQSDTGGYDYQVGDRLTVTGGSGTAVVTVLTVRPGAIKSFNIHIGGAGTGYAPGDDIDVNGGTGIVPYAHMTVLTVGGSGEVLTVNMYIYGAGYTPATNVSTITNGAGTGFSIDITAIGDAVATWGIQSDADHGSGYAANTLFVPLTGGHGTGASLEIVTVFSGTLTKSGTQTWAEAGFQVGVSSGRFKVVINGTTYTYGTPSSFGSTTWGDTTTLVGITPDPSAEPANSIVVEAVTTYANNNTSTGLPTTFNNDLIASLEQRLYIGSLTDSRIWVSSINLNNNTGHYDPLNAWGAFFVGFYGAPMQFLTTSPPTAFIPQEEFIYISAGKDEWYNVQLDVDLNSADLTTSPPVQPVQSLKITRLNTTAQQAAQTQAATSKIANSIVYLSFEPIINTFGRVTDIFLTPQITDLSFPIVNDMNAYDFTNASLCYYRKFVYVAVPKEGLVLAYNMTDVKNPYWEAPQVMPISRFSIIGGLLFGHSSLVSETYQLFNGTNDNGNPILARAAFSFNNYGTRSQSKGYNEFYVEGYITANTDLTLGIQYDIDGCATNTYFEINGDDTQIVCISKDDASLGKTSLGKTPLGSTIISDPNANKPKFRVVKTFPTRYFYEDQISFTSEGIDEQWEILAFGPQLQANTDLNNAITQ